MQKRQNPLNWQQRDKDRLLRNFNKNLSLNTISKIYGVSPATIRKWVQTLTNVKEKSP
jgi:transposase-like protein